MNSVSCDFTIGEYDLDGMDRLEALEYVRQRSARNLGKVFGLECSPVVPSVVARFLDGVQIFSADIEVERQWHRRSKELLKREVA